MRKLGIVVGGIALSWIAIAAGSFNVGAAQTTVYTRTVVGMDFHALDYRQRVQFVPSTGGGAYLEGIGAYPSYMEVSVDLPVGAMIKKVTIFYKDCFDDLQFGAQATWYFGAYSPSGGFGDLAPSKSRATCSFSNLALIPSGHVQVLASQRYTIGMASKSAQQTSGSPDPNPDVMVRGARVSYTCPVKCLP